MVFCQQVVTPGRVVNVTEEESCPSKKPPVTQVCETAPCSTTTPEYPDIEVDSSKYVQLKQKRKIAITVGGSATVIPGTNVIVKCPVKNYDKKYIHWRRTQNEIAKTGRIKVSKRGYLQIRKSKTTDSDTYECMVVMDDNHVMGKANISIDFHSDFDGEEQLQWRKQYMMDMHRNGGHNHNNHHQSATDSLTANTVHKMNKNDKLLIDSLMGDELNHSVPYMYISTQWSPCTKTCGGAGYQMRNISCELVTENYYR